MQKVCHEYIQATDTLWILYPVLVILLSKGYRRIRKISEEGYDRDIRSHKCYEKGELGTVIH